MPADKIESAFGAVVSSCMPSMWPRPLRRLFVLTLPVSVPLWLAWCAATVVLLVAAGFAFMFGVMVACAVCGVIIHPVVWAFAALERLWSDQ